MREEEELEDGRSKVKNARLEEDQRMEQRMRGDVIFLYKDGRENDRSE